MRPSAAVAASFVAGLIYAASFWPWPHWWLTVVALAALVTCVVNDARGTGRSGFACGFAFGLGGFTAGLSWLYISMHRYGGMPAALALLALLLFAAWLALFPGLAGLILQGCAVRLRRTGCRPALRATALAAGFAGAWTLGEMLRGWIFTGFPWLSAGYAQIDGPLSAFAPLLGVYGISAMAALAGGAAALALGDRTARVPATLLALLPVVTGLALAAIDWRAPVGAPIAVRLVQGNIAQDMKFDPQRSVTAMQWYAGQISPQAKRLTVLPETAWTVPWSYTPEFVRSALTAALQRGGGVAAIGMPLDARGVTNAALAPAANAADGRITNSMAIIDASGAIVWRYDKRHLVPFGEFVPPGFRWFVDRMHIPLGDFARGGNNQPAFAFAGQKLAFDICYEDLFGDEIAAQVRHGATILVNASNIAWFGDSHALPQHLQVARMRAIETARPMLRATNTGVTAAIDARGEVIARLPPYTAGVIDVEVQGHDRLTPAARLGDAPALALSVILLIGASVLCRLAPRRSR